MRLEKFQLCDSWCWCGFSAGATDTGLYYNLTYLYAYSAKASLKLVRGNNNLGSNGQAALAGGDNAFFQTCGDSLLAIWMLELSLV